MRVKGYLLQHCITRRVVGKITLGSSYAIVIAILVKWDLMYIKLSSLCCNNISFMLLKITSRIST